MLVQSKYGGAMVARITADAFEHAVSIVEAGIDKGDNTFRGGSQAAIDPNVGGSAGHRGPRLQYFELIKTTGQDWLEQAPASFSL
jgi:hypothetical protein